MWFADFALRRPYTIVASLILVCLMGLGAGLRMPIDIFPEIDIPVVSVVWTYNGMSAPDIRDRILTLHQRQLASLVDDISRIEATAYAGVGVEKVYLHEGANVTRAISQLASSALVVLKYMPPNITPPLVLRYGATDVPIIQLSLSSDSLPDSKLNDLGQNIIRPDLAVVHGAEVPYPYGGKPRVIMVDLDQQALASRGLTPSDVATAIQQQNVILPSGDVKIGDQGLFAGDEQQPRRDRGHQPFSGQGGGRPGRVRARRRPCSRRLSNPDQFGERRRPAGRADDGAQDRRRFDAGGDRRRAGSAAGCQAADAAGRRHQGDFRSVGFRQGFAQQRSDGRDDGGRTDGNDDPAVSRQLAVDADHPGDNSDLDHRRHPHHVSSAARR